LQIRLIICIILYCIKSAMKFPFLVRICVNLMVHFSNDASCSPLCNAQYGCLLQLNFFVTEVYYLKLYVTSFLSTAKLNS
jgi:hypothetical protein